jgi:succinate dehydrogenase / fumarate reductase cytochrome b subunit
MFKTTGFISFALRRFTGVVLVLYLMLHIWVIGAATQGAEAFNRRMEVFATPLTHVLEIFLLAAVAYHAFDGIRLLLVNFFRVTRPRKSMWYAAFAVAALLTVVGGLPILLYALGISY